MATIVSFEGREPVIDESAWLAPTAVVIGDVEIGPEASIWYGAVLRGDFDRIVVGAGTSLQDNAVVHVAPGHPTLIGNRVTVGHGALLEGCRVEAGAMVGMGAVVLRDAVVGAGALLAAGCVLPERRRAEARCIAAGTPARVVKRLEGEVADRVAEGSSEYADLARRYRASAVHRPVP